MNSYNNITNPISGGVFSIFSLQGKNLLKQYVSILQNGGTQPAIASTPSNLNRQPSLETYDRNQDKLKDLNLETHATMESIKNVINKKSNTKKTKTTKKDSQCERIKKNLKNAEKTVSEFQHEYNKTCSEEHKQQANKALELINPFE